MSNIASSSAADPGPPNLRSADAVMRGALRAIASMSGTGASAVAGRARLRSGLGREVGSVPEIWRHTLEDGTEAQLGSAPTRGEKALHVALTLWAMHQGSHPQPMHASGRRSIGASVRRLAMTQSNGSQAAESHPIYRRLCAMIAAPSFDSLSVHARGVIQLLSSADVKLDYGRFAADLYRWQDPRQRSAVVRQWGRDFARSSAPLEEPDATQAEDPASSDQPDLN